MCCMTIGFIPINLGGQTLAIDRSMILAFEPHAETPSHRIPRAIHAVVSDVFQQEDDSCGDWQMHGRYHCLGIQPKQSTISREARKRALLTERLTN